MNLSPHFNLHEFTYSDTAIRRGFENTPSSVQIDNLRKVAALLEEVRELFGNKPVKVSSGYRCFALNHAIGGVVDSAHLYGCAADFTVPGVPLWHVAQLIAEFKLPFDQLIYEYGTWVHLGIPRHGDEPRRQVLTKTHAGYLDGLVKI